MKDAGRRRLSRAQTGRRNVTRQPRSCYATADPLTHICGSGDAGTGAKCPRARSSSRSTRAAKPQRPRSRGGRTGAKFPRFGRFPVREDAGRDRFCVGEAYAVRPLLPDQESNPVISRQTSWIVKKS